MYLSESLGPKVVAENGIYRLPKTKNRICSYLMYLSESFGPKVVAEDEVDGAVRKCQ